VRKLKRSRLICESRAGSWSVKIYLMPMAQRLRVESGDSCMSELDQVKEKIAYAKFVLGALLVADTSLISWVLSNAAESSLLRVACCGAAILSLTTCAALTHRIIDKRIRQLKDL
jgi:hypothetical protein